MKTVRAVSLFLLFSVATAVYTATDCCYSDSACTTRSRDEGVTYTNATSCAGTSAGTCIASVGNNFTKVTACNSGAVPTPAAGIWWTYFSDSACAGSLVMTRQNNAPSCSAVPSGGPPGVVSAKAACTTGGGAQLWGYAAGDCSGTPIFVLDIGASLASSTRRAFGACGAQSGGPASSASEKVACYGDQVAPLTPGSQLTPSPSPTPMPTCQGAAAATTAASAPIACYQGYEFSVSNPAKAYEAQVVQATTSSVAAVNHKLCFSITGECATNTSCNGLAPKGATVRIYGGFQRCAPPPNTHTHTLALFHSTATLERLINSPPPDPPSSPLPLFRQP